jgi:imidazolonepropionase-like amidohydrolase
MRLYLKNARLVDGTGRSLQEGAAIIIEGDTIVHAGRLSAADAPREGATVVDLDGRTVIPGLIPCGTSACFRIGSDSPSCRAGAS